MTNKTEDVKILVQEVLQTISEPYGEDIIWDVCLRIEGNRDWYRIYEELCDELSNDVVNNWIGKYTKGFTGLNNLRRSPAPRKHIITSFTKLR